MKPLSPEQVKNLQQKIKADPVYFAEKILGLTLWDKQKEILESVRDYSETSVKSCHASGKTFTAAIAIHWWLCGESDSIVITTAPTFRQVKEILWREVKSMSAGKAVYPVEAVLDTQINLGPKWFALGLSTDRPDQFQGFHSKRLLVVGDEASGIAQNIYEATDGLAATRYLWGGNPLQNTGRFADSFKNVNVHKITISAFDTPNVKEGRIVVPGLITSADIERMRSYYGEDSNVYRVRVLGEFPTGDADSLISVDDVYKAIQREISVQPAWEKKMGVDVARFGNDRTVIIVRQMDKVLRKEVFFSLDTMKVTGHVLRIAKEEKVLPQNVGVDVVGVGGGVVDRLKEQGWNVSGVNVGESAKDTEHYANLRAELYDYHVKGWLKTGDLPSDDDYYELANIKYSFNSRGQMLIESKDEMKKRGLNSPDVADALMLSFASSGFIPVFQQSKPLVGYYNDRDVSF